MLESEIKKLTSAVTELTAALQTVRLPAAASADAPVKSTPAPKAAGTTETAPAATPELAPPPPEVVPTTGDAESTAEVAAVPTKKALVEKFIELAQEKDREVAIKLLADFGVVKLPDLKDKAKWADFIVACDALLAA